SVSLARVDRLEHVEIGGRFDRSLCVARRLRQVDHDVVGRERRIEGEVDFADQLFVRASGAEGVAAGDDLPALDPEAEDCRVGRLCVDHQNCQGSDNKLLHTSSTKNAKAAKDAELHSTNLMAPRWCGCWTAWDVPRNWRRPSSPGGSGARSSPSSRS